MKANRVFLDTGWQDLFESFYDTQKIDCNNYAIISST